MPAAAFRFGANGRECADGGRDDQDRPAQELAHGGGDQRGRGAVGELRVDACPSQAERCWRGRRGGRSGPGRWRAPLAWATCSLDVPPKLAARMRLLQAGDTNENDPNDAFSVAVAALRAKAQRPVIAEDHAAVLKVWAKRHRDLARARNQAACRLHVVRCDLVPGGHSREISAAHAARILERVTPSGAVAGARCELAAEFLTDIRRLDALLREANKRLAAAVRASGTSLTGIFGVGPVIAGTVIGDVRQVFRFPAGTTSPPTTAPRWWRYLPAAGRSTGCRCSATAGSTTPSTWPRSARSGISTARGGPTTTRKSTRARPTRRRCDPSSGGSAAPSTRRW
jgi:hypothetical protein